MDATEVLKPARHPHTTLPTAYNVRFSTHTHTHKIKKGRKKECTSLRHNNQHFDFRNLRSVLWTTAVHEPCHARSQVSRADKRLEQILRQHEHLGLWVIILCLGNVDLQ